MLESARIVWHFDSLPANNALEPGLTGAREGDFWVGPGNPTADFAGHHGMRAVGQTQVWRSLTFDEFFRGTDCGPVTRAIALGSAENPGWPTQVGVPCRDPGLAEGRSRQRRGERGRALIFGAVRIILPSSPRMP